MVRSQVQFSTVQICRHSADAEFLREGKEHKKVKFENTNVLSDSAKHVRSILAPLSCSALQNYRSTSLEVSKEDIFDRSNMSADAGDVSEHEKMVRHVAAVQDCQRHARGGLGGPKAPNVRK